MTQSNKRFTVTQYLNDSVVNSITGLTPHQSYKAAVPEEALQPSATNRWHLMMYAFACDKMNELDIGAPLMVAWEETSDANPGLDCRHVIIYREEDDDDQDMEDPPQ
jgi:hypothetical protein